MIRVERVDEPAGFDASVRKKGQSALLELIGSPEAPKRRGKKREKLADRIEDLPADALPAYWRDALPDLRTA
ncbi:hypothetical protein [Sorangium sp. So ce131]|uniref:hypothetical protein n=1 Tax=Sorangium sp. So ce131 TaxID=3133282 RepID=UPI003F5EFEAA